MIDFNEFITEGVYDKHIFKAFFLAGGPGSGKSWVSGKTLMGAGMKVINSDDAFERILKKEKMSLDMNTHTAAQVKVRDKLRGKAKRGTSSGLQHAIDGRLGLILDSTARDTSRIESEMKTMGYIGYDTHMVFVNTTLEVALKRNQLRPRSVPDAIVIQSHKQIQKAIPVLQNIFGRKNFILVDNSVEAEDVNVKVYKEIRKLMNKKPSKEMAQAWIRRELAAKKR